jgi:hypothetical protein
MRRIKDENSRPICINKDYQIPVNYYPFNSSLYPNYLPVDDYVLNSTLIFNRADVLANIGIKNLMTKLANKEEINVFILGSSMNAGAGCIQDELNGKTCSWGNRFYLWLQKTFPNSIIRLHHKARGGTQTSTTLGALFNLLKAKLDDGRLKSPDLILTDFSVNDMVYFIF